MIVEKITRFETITPSGAIYDKNGLYYLWDRAGLVFNMGRGDFFGDTDKIGLLGGKMKYFDTYKKRIKTDFEYEITDLTDTGFVKYYPASKQYKVFIGRSLLSKQSPVQFFVYLHELGHVYNCKTELKCDLFAVRNMIGYGFNPSQIFAASYILHFDEKRRSGVEKYIIKKFSR